MWRAFGGNTARVAIVFKVRILPEGANPLNLIFSPVAYLTEDETHTVIHEVIKNIEANCSFLSSVRREIIVGTVFVMLLAGVTCLKHEAFREEREWRAIYSPKRLPSTLVESSIEVIGGVPQLVYKLPLDVTASPALAHLDFSRVFDRAIIGPSSYPWAMYEAFAEALTKAGVPDAPERVWASNIPLRA